MLDELSQAGLGFENPIQTLARRVDDDVQPQRLVHPSVALMQRLQGKARAQIAAIAFPDPEGADDVVQHLVAAAIEPVVDGGAIVLEG